MKKKTENIELKLKISGRNSEFVKKLNKIIKKEVAKTKDNANYPVLNMC